MAFLKPELWHKHTVARFARRWVVVWSEQCVTCLACIPWWQKSGIMQERQEVGVVSVVRGQGLVESGPTSRNRSPGF